MSRRTLAIVMVALLAGCSSATAETPPAAPASAPAGDQRPVFRFDATEDEKKAMAKPWVDCLVKNAGRKYQDKAEELIGKGGVTADDPKGEAALRTCLPQQPEAFDEHQRRTDLTAFRDNQREWYKCARAAGYQLTAPDPDTGQFGLSRIGPNGDFDSPAIQECKRKAFTD